MHPLVDSLDNLSINELEKKIQELTDKYFMTKSSELKYQIQLILDQYNEAYSVRVTKEMEDALAKQSKRLGSLINITKHAV